MRRKSTATRPQAPRSDKADKGSVSKPSMITTASLAIIAGAFIVGIGVGVAFFSGTNFTPNNISSREAIDQAAPSRDICINYGSSAIVTESRTFVTFNPFKVYVSKPIMQPGCVLRSNGWAVLDQRKLISNERERECKQRMQTFAYTGNLENSPKIDCVNPSEENKFLDQPGTAPAVSDKSF